MAGPVEKIYVEIGAPIAKLDQDMRRNERRVDQGATRMAASVRRAETGVVAGAAGMSGAFLKSSRFALGAAGIGLSGAFLARNFEDVNIKVNKAIRGTLGILSDLANGIVDVNKIASRNAGGMVKWFGRQADTAYAALTGGQTPSEQEAEMARFRDLARLGEDADLELRKAKEITEEGKKQIELERRLLELQRQRDDTIKAAPENAAQIQAAYDKMMEAARLDAATKPATPAEAKARFDTISTVFGGMKLAQRNGGTQQKAAEDTAKNTKETAQGVKALTAAIQRNSIAIVGFA